MKLTLSQTSFLKQHPEYLLYLVFAQAVIATLGSLYFSEVMLLTPCVLCWYQRIVMYPMVLISAIGIVREDRNVVWYALPMSIIGALIAAYHSALQYGWLPESAATCKAGVSCTDIDFQLFGFVTIPLLAFVGFIVVSLGLVLYYRLTAPSEE